MDVHNIQLGLAHALKESILCINVLYSRARHARFHETKKKRFKLTLVLLWY